MFFGSETSEPLVRSCHSPSMQAFWTLIRVSVRALSVGFVSCLQPALAIKVNLRLSGCHENIAHPSSVSEESFQGC